MHKWPIIDGSTDSSDDVDSIASSDSSINIDSSDISDNIDSSGGSDSTVVISVCRKGSGVTTLVCEAIMISSQVFI